MGQDQLNAKRTESAAGWGLLALTMLWSLMALGQTPARAQDTEIDAHGSLVSRPSSLVSRPSPLIPHPSSLVPHPSPLIPRP